MIVQHNGILESEATDAHIAKLVGIVNLCIASKMVAPELYPKVNDAIEEKRRDCDAHFASNQRSGQADMTLSTCR